MEETEEKEVITKEDFSDAVLLSQKVGRYKGMAVKDIIVGLCEDKGIDVEDVPELLTERVKRRLENEEIQARNVKGRVNKNRLF